jgi:DNA polymerase V
MTAKAKPKQGGQRHGAGRKPGTGVFGEPTVSVRIPQSQLNKVLSWREGYKLQVSGESSLPEGTAVALEPLPLHLDTPPALTPAMTYRIQAGFPSPAEDYVEPGLDLNEHLIQHKEATFIVRVRGYSMINAGIYDGDELIVDRALTAADGNVVVAVIDGELTIKRLRRTTDGYKLCAENPAYPDIELRSGQELQVWGVVTRVLHKV